MSYIDQTQANSRRTKAIIGVAAIHALIGYGLISGLTIEDFVSPPPPPPLEIKDYKDPPPPDPIPTPEPNPKPSQAVDQAVVAPKPPLDFTRPQMPRIDQFDPTAEVGPLIDIPAPRPDPGPAIPAPRPSFAPKGPAPSNSILNWVRTEDYPGAALRREQEGTVSYRVIVGTDGKVDACEITASSGHAALDDAACKLISRRARFDPATNDKGTEVVGAFTGSVSWQIPE